MSSPDGINTDSGFFFDFDLRLTVNFETMKQTRNGRILL